MEVRGAPPLCPNTHTLWGSCCKQWSLRKIRTSPLLPLLMLSPHNLLASDPSQPPLCSLTSFCLKWWCLPCPFLSSQLFEFYHLSQSPFQVTCSICSLKYGNGLFHIWPFHTHWQNQVPYHSLPWVSHHSSLLTSPVPPSEVCCVFRRSVPRDKHPSLWRV